MSKCSACKQEIGQKNGAPWLRFKELELCSSCYIELIVPIFEMRNAGDGGLIDIVFQECVNLDYNLKRKKNSIPTSKLGQRISKHFPTS